MPKVLVAYFSCGGVTKSVATKLAKVSNGDLFEIKPTTPYTSDDLDWENTNSRSSKEMKDKSFRPSIASKVANMDEYETIYLGFPIWWYVAPTIINTFLESYDLKDKTIIPFATSGSSQMGKTNQELKPSCGNANLVEGKRFSQDVSEEALSEWIRGK